MSIKNLFLTILICAANHALQSQIITYAPFSVERFNGNVIQINNTKSSIKLTVVVFRKESYRESLSWLIAKHIENIDTINVRFIEFEYPENCPQTPKEKTPIFIDDLELTDYPIPKMGSSFKVILIPHKQHTDWIVNKIGKESLSNLVAHYPDIGNKKNKKSQVPNYYEFTDLNNFNSQFTYLVSNKIEYRNTEQIKNDLRDSIGLLRMRINTIDSLNRIKNRQFIELEATFTPLGQPKYMQPSVDYMSYAIKLGKYFGKDAKTLVSIGVGQNQILLNSKIQNVQFDLGSFNDEFGDMYYCILSQFGSVEKFRANSNSFVLDINRRHYFSKFKKNTLELEYSINYGINITHNSKPTISEAQVTLANELKLVKQYPILNFDYIVSDPTISTVLPDNFVDFFLFNPFVGFDVAFNSKFHFNSKFNFLNSTSILGKNTESIKMESNTIHYSPMTLTQQKLKIQSFGFTFSLGYELF